VKRKVITFGFSKNFQIYPKNLNLKENYSTFEVEYNGEGAEIKINLPGKHNVLNALAAISTAYELEIPLWITKEALEEFKGLERRFEFKGERKGIGWLDDYAHHPTEIRETLLTAKNFWKKGRIVVIFQPHRYTRTYYLYKDFSKSLKIADIVLILPIYPAGEKKIKGVKSDLIYKEMKKIKKDVYLVKDEELDEKLKEILSEGDLLVSIGAGDVWRKVKKIFENL
jgi:UDP-N-acetylmuramate--alanine ligase